MRIAAQHRCLWVKHAPESPAIPSYQHIWDPLTAEAVRNHTVADVFNIRLSTTW
jgi:hypothetical protein